MDIRVKFRTKKDGFPCITSKEEENLKITIFHKPCAVDTDIPEDSLHALAHIWKQTTSHLINSLNLLQLSNGFIAQINGITSLHCPCFTHSS